MRSNPQTSARALRLAGRAITILAALSFLLVCPAAPSRELVPASLFRDRNAAASNSTTTHSATATVPAQTEISTELLSGIHTQINRVGDVVTARLSRPVYVNGRVILPPGTLLDGRITSVRPAGRLRRPAALGLRFDKIALPDGETEPVHGVVAALDVPPPLQIRVDSEGHVKAGGSFPWKTVAMAVLGLSALTVARVPVGGSAVFGALIPASGATALSYAFIWRRGKDVHLPPETHCQVRLTYPVTVRVAW